MTELNSGIFESFVRTLSREQVTDQGLEEFRQRVFSFIEEQKWVSSSRILSPLVCARYGWRCVSATMLECVACGAKINTKEPKMEIYDAYKSCVNKIAADLKDGHKAHCHWPLAPSPESFVSIIPLPKEEALSQFANRLKSCLEFKSSIPQIADSVPSILGLMQDDAMSLCKIAKINPVDSDVIGMSGVCFAATGWTLVSKKNGEINTYIKCDSCQRLMWAKSFNLVNVSSTGATSKENEEDSGKKQSLTVRKVANCDKESTSLEENSKTNGRESSNKRSSEDVSTSEKPLKKFKLDRRDFSPLEEHRSWCCWVSMTEVKVLTQVKDDDKKDIITSVPGWKLFIKSLLRNIQTAQDNSPESTPSKERFRSVRDLLETWTSPTSL